VDCGDKHPVGQCPLPSCDESSEGDEEASLCQGRGCGECKHCLEDDSGEYVRVRPRKRAYYKRPIYRNAAEPDCTTVGVMYVVREFRARAANGIGFMTVRTIIPRNCSNPAHGHFVIHTYTHYDQGGIEYQKD
jgi:hypothetical protein